MNGAYWYFKLFGNIKEKHEVDLARLELESLFGPITPVRNFYDILAGDLSFSKFTDRPARIQDRLAHELPYGDTHGFIGIRDVDEATARRLVRRLAYTRELFIVTRSTNKLNVGQKGINHVEFSFGDLTLHQLITNQFYLEKSVYISKLSRNEEEVDANIEELWKFLATDELLFRIPASSTMQVGKRLVDYLTTREEPSLYLNHYMHPYKGKFHPKMVRALLNYIWPYDEGTVMDNFAGCGTLLLEASWMGLDSIGVEINPLSALMSNVKCFSLYSPSFNPAALRGFLLKFLNDLETQLAIYHSEGLLGHSSPESTLVNKKAIQMKLQEIDPKVSKFLKDKHAIEDILVAKQQVENYPVNGEEGRQLKDFLTLAISGAISDLVRRSKGSFQDVLRERLLGRGGLYLRIYLFHQLNRVLDIKLGHSECYTADTTKMSELFRSPVADGIVTSPPYSTALDYIKNDFPQIILLGLDHIEELADKMIGNPNLSVYKKHEKALLREIDLETGSFLALPEVARDAIKTIKKTREMDAIRTYKFFKDMQKTMLEVHKVMKPGAKAVIIIGNNHYKLGTKEEGTYYEVRNDEVLKRMAVSSTECRYELDYHILKLRSDEGEGGNDSDLLSNEFEGTTSVMDRYENGLLRRKLEKSRAGNIRYESILVLRKPSAVIGPPQSEASAELADAKRAHDTF